MFEYHDIITDSWNDYELLDSGNGRKLERFGSIITDRPDTQAIWLPTQPNAWKDAHATFTFSGKEGSWSFSKEVPSEWTIGHEGMQLILRFGNFKHLGVFPEHASQWQWIGDRVRQCSGTDANVSVLNLFGYTGAATIAAAKAGAKVTHVDASKQSVTWANENAAASELASDAVRWIVDDATTFVKREVKRRAQYHGIILDPPVFGRGSKGQVWHIDTDLVPLLQNLTQLLSPEAGSFMLLSGYAAGYAPHSFAQVMESVCGAGNGSFGALHIKERSERVLPTGVYVRYLR